MFRGGIAIALMIMTTPALAGPVLWGKVEADMSFEAVRAAYPDAHVHSGKGLVRPMLFISSYDLDGCSASVDILIDRKVTDPAAKVEGVHVYGEKCDAKIFSNLLAKYGEPLTINNDNDDKKKTARWVVDGRAIVYKRLAGGSWASDSWEIDYTAVKDMGL